MGAGARGAALTKTGATDLMAKGLVYRGVARADAMRAAVVFSSRRMSRCPR